MWFRPVTHCAGKGRNRRGSASSNSTVAFQFHPQLRNLALKLVVTPACCRAGGAAALTANESTPCPVGCRTSYAGCRRCRVLCGQAGI